MKNLEETNSKIFNLVKQEKEVEYTDLYLRLKTSDLNVRESIAKLKTEYGLIFVINEKISLTEKGEKHKDFDSYLKSLNKKTVDLYKVTSIIISLFALYLGYLNYNLKQNEKVKNDRVSELNIENTSLNKTIEIYKDSLSETKEQLKLLKSKSSENTLISKNKND